MADTWYSEDPAPPSNPIGISGWFLAILRAVPIVLVLMIGMILLLTLRALERPFSGQNRPLTGRLVQCVCVVILWCLGMRCRRIGQPMAGPGAIVANHSSWLDILTLNAGAPVYFVSKSEVAGWAGVGWLAKATGTVFIQRHKGKAAQQVALFQNRLQAGHQLLFFPEGTSSDGLRVLPFKSTLFAAFFQPELAHSMQIQPVTVHYSSPEGADNRFYGWWGGMELGPHLLQVLARWRQGTVCVTYHEPIRLGGYADRKALARTLEAQVRLGFHGRAQVEQS